MQQANILFSGKKDAPARLQKLIKQIFHANFSDFDINWRSTTMENNSLITLASRQTHLKCIRLIVEYYKSNINLCDVGGFTPLILCAYHGSLNGVMYCIKNGADMGAQGRLRSGQCLSAEHWAAVQGHQEVFLYLRAVRLRRHKTSANAAVAPTVVGHSNGSSSATCIREDPSQLTAYAVAASERLLNDILQTSSSNSSGVSAEEQQRESFCLCGRGFEGAMVACEAPGCAVEWFHFACVGLAEEVRAIIFSSDLEVVTYYCQLSPA